MKKLPLLFALPLAVSVATGALADDKSGFYIGGGTGYGQTSFKKQVGADQMPGGEEPGHLNFKEGGARLNLHSGYRFNNYFGVEASYDNGGKLKEKDFAKHGSNSADLELKSQSFGAAVVGYLPINNSFELYGKAGVARAEYKFSPQSGGVKPGTEKFNETSPFAAIGANYSLSKNVDLYGEARYMKTKIKSLKLDDSSMNIGVRYNF